MQRGRKEGSYFFLLLLAGLAGGGGAGLGAGGAGFGAGAGADGFGAGAGADALAGGGGAGLGAGAAALGAGAATGADLAIATAVGVVAGATWLLVLVGNASRRVPDPTLRPGNVSRPLEGGTPWPTMSLRIYLPSFARPRTVSAKN